MQGKETIRSYLYDNKCVYVCDEAGEKKNAGSRNAYYAPPLDLSDRHRSNYWDNYTAECLLHV